MKANSTKLFLLKRPDGKYIIPTAYSTDGIEIREKVPQRVFFVSKADARLFANERGITAYSIEKFEFPIDFVQQYTSEGYYEKPTASWQTSVKRMALVWNEARQVYISMESDNILRSDPFPQVCEAIAE